MQIEAMDKPSRLRRARLKAGFDTASEAARALRMKEPTYLGHENGSRDFDATTAAVYARKFHVDPVWLLYGSEHYEMPDDLKRESEESTHRLVASNAGSDLAYKAALPGASPELDVRVGAGEGAVGSEAVYALSASGSYSGHVVLAEWVFPMQFLRNELQARAGRTVVISVQGDSMRPTLEPGDRVIVDISQNKFGPDGAIYVISDFDDEPQVKRLQVEDDDPIRIRVGSDNPAVKPRIVSPDRIKIIGRVVGKVSRL